MASHRISDWIVATGEIGVVLETVIPHLDTLKQEAEEDPLKQEEFKVLSTAILAGSLAASPDSYVNYLSLIIDRGDLGKPDETVSNLFRTITSEDYKNKFIGNKSERHRLILRVLDHLQSKENPELSEEAALHVPARLLFSMYSFHTAYSSLGQVKEVWESRRILVPKMAEALAQDPDLFSEDLERKVLSGEFGQSEEVFTFLLNYLSDEKNLPEERPENWQKDYELLMPIIASGLSLDSDSDQ